jgi:hypothetical protein
LHGSGAADAVGAAGRNFEVGLVAEGVVAEAGFTAKLGLGKWA